MGAIESSGAAGEPLAGLYGFVKTHLVVVNAVVVASASFVAAMDFLAPKLAVVPTLVYSATGVLVLLMLAAAFAPGLVGRLFASLGFSARRDGRVALWRRPAWQFSTAILIGITAIGFASVARASEGGLIASKFPDVKLWQASLLSLEADSQEIKRGVAAANGKLDRIVDVVDPDNPADRCPDIACAIQGRASAKAVKTLFDKGARIEGGAPNRGELSKGIATSRRHDRLQVLDMLIEHGLDPAAIIFAFATSQDELNPESLRIAREVQRASGVGDRFIYSIPGADTPDLALWGQVNGCLLRTSKGTSLLELAAIRGDLELYRHLAERGVSLPSRPLLCKWADVGQPSGARIVIKDGVATVAPLRL